MVACISDVSSILERRASAYQTWLMDFEVAMLAYKLLLSIRDRFKTSGAVTL